MRGEPVTLATVICSFAVRVAPPLGPLPRYVLAPLECGRPGGVRFCPDQSPDDARAKGGGVFVIDCLI